MSHSSVKAYYDRYAEFFNIVAGNNGYYNLGWLPEGSRELYADAQQKLVSKVTDIWHKGEADSNTKRILLDAGCGQGAPASFVSGQCGAKVIGLDLLQSQLRLWHKSDAIDIVPLRGDSCVLPFADSSMDGIYSIESAFHYPDKTAFLKECLRVVKPRGYLSLADVVHTKRNPDSQPAKLARDVFGSTETFGRDKYLKTAEELGWRVESTEDLTPGVVRSLRTIPATLNEKQDEFAAAGYSRLLVWQFRQFCTIFGLFCKLAELKYHLYVFVKPAE